MTINGREYSEPEIRAMIKVMNDEIKRRDDKNKELKRLLKLAIATFTRLEVDCLFFQNCDKCPLYNKEKDFCEWKEKDFCEWKYRKEALKLIGDEEDDT